MKQARCSRCKHYLLQFAVFAPVLAGLGCQRTGNVAGKVTYQDQAVVYGTVLVLGSDGTVHQGNIREDGSFNVTGIRIGEARLAVSSPDPNTAVASRGELSAEESAERQRRAALKPKWFPIPNGLADPNKSGLKLEVKGGENLHNIQLK
jgi:hypothetical protein